MSLVTTEGIAAVVAFAATNIGWCGYPCAFLFIHLCFREDDFVVLLVFFAKAKTEKELPANVLLGQLIGFTFILLISSIGLLFGAVVPQGYIGLIG
jgi:cadmium resistance protein CadD (predicted permease)